MDNCIGIIAEGPKGFLHERLIFFLTVERTTTNMCENLRLFMIQAEAWRRDEKVARQLVMHQEIGRDCPPYVEDANLSPKACISIIIP